MIRRFRFRRSRPLPNEPAPPLENEVWPVALLLFVASLLRVLQALWQGAPFGVEPTLALGCVLGSAWLAARRWRKRARGERRSG